MGRRPSGLPSAGQCPGWRLPPEAPKGPNSKAQGNALGRAPTPPRSKAQQAVTMARETPTPSVNALRSVGPCEISARSAFPGLRPGLSSCAPSGQKRRCSTRNRNGINDNCNETNFCTTQPGAVSSRLSVRSLRLGRHYGTFRELLAPGYQFGHFLPLPVESGTSIICTPSTSMSLLLRK